MIRHILSVVVLSCSFGVLACGGEEPPKDPGKTPAPAAAKTPKEFIAHQVALIKAGNADELRAGFTARHQGSITAEAVKKAQAEVGKMSLDELCAAVELSADQKRAKITMNDGRSLTTLVKTDTGWLADTIWFK